MGEKSCIYEFILQLGEKSCIVWLLGEHILEQVHFYLLEHTLAFKRVNIELRVILKGFNITSNGLLETEMVKLTVINS